MRIPKKQRRVRLKGFSYKGCYRYFVTIATDRRETFFQNKKLVKKILPILRTTSESYGFIVWAYCFMPDHLHLLIEGKAEYSDMRKFISMFKQKTAYLFKEEFGTRLWQENYYEHILRQEEDTKAVAKYIFENPVRKGLVDMFVDYLFLGSFVFDVKEMI